jgi:hypothetical protein
MSLVRRYPLTAFFALACALSWWPWILYSFDLAPNPIVGVGPFLAALVVLAVTEGKSGVMRLLRRMVRWRVGSNGMPWRSCTLTSTTLRSRLLYRHANIHDATVAITCTESRSVTAPGLHWL